MKTTIQLTLVQPARKSGGDKYEAEVNSQLIAIYLPQSITRIGGQPIQTFEMTLKPLPYPEGRLIPE